MPVIVGSVTVSYDRKKKLWEAANGSHIASYAAGPEGKTAAVDRAILEEDPELHELATNMIDRHPGMTKMAYRAARLIINDNVHEDDNLIKNGVAVVKSQRDPVKTYTIQRRGILICPCKFWQELHDYPVPTHGDQKICKHVLAVLMLHKMGRFIIKET